MEKKEQQEKKDQQDALFQAVIRNDLTTALDVLSRGLVKVNQTNNQGKTVLFIALSNEYVPMVKLLMKYEANLNQTSYCHVYCTYEKPLATAARLRRRDMVDLLFEGGAVQEGLNASYGEGKTALQWAASHGDISLAKLLLNRGADINWIGQYFHTALHYATISDKPDMVKWLLENGAEINTNSDGRSPLHIAAVRGNLQIVKHLLDYGAHVDTSDSFNFTPFSLACLRGHIDVVTIILDNTKDKATLDLECGLCKASEGGHIETMKYLLQNKVNVNVRNSLGETALSLAARGQSLAVEVLLDHNANINTVDKRGYTPLQLALLREQMDISRLLIQHGALLNLLVSQGTESPLWIAHAASNAVLIKYIIQAGCHLSKERWFTPIAAQEKLKELDFHCPGPLRFRRGVHLRQDLWEWVISSFSQPKTLLQFCRIAVRETLSEVTGGSSIIHSLQKLPLPQSALRYLFLDDLIWE